MHRLTIRQQHNPQVPVVHFFDRRPAPDASVFLHNFPHRTADHPLDPLLLNDGTIRAPSNEVEVFCEFHRALAPYSPALYTQGSVLKTPSFIYYPASMPSWTHAAVSQPPRPHEN